MDLEVFSPLLVMSVSALALGIAVIAYFFFFSHSKTPEVKREIPLKPIAPISKQPSKSRKKKMEGGIPLKIFFGSQTGTAEDFSKTLADEAKKYKFDAEVFDLENYSLDELPEEKLVIFVLATYGDGEPTDNAKEFYEALMSPDVASDFLSSKTKFTVFSLGNKTYPHYNAIGRAVDHRLGELGAERIFERGEGDDDGSLEEDFNAWKRKLWPTLGAFFGLELPIPTMEDEIVKRKCKIQFYTDSSAPPASPSLSRSNNSGYDAKYPLQRTVIVNRELHTELSDRSCRHLEIDITGCSYEPGDHLGIYPENNESIVMEFAKRLNLLDQMDKVFVLRPIEGGASSSIGPCTIETALKTVFELSALPRKNLLKALVQYSTGQDKQQLALLASETPEGLAYYNSFVKGDQRTLPELLEAFPSCDPPFDHVFELLPRLQPRYYSIASSQKGNHPDHVHITSVVVRYTTPTGRIHNGVCSSWLANLRPSQDIIRIFLRKSTFHIPKEISTPIVMIGPGTGLAPFRGFIHERNFLGARSDSNVLFFGCRARNIDFLYQEELTELNDSNVISLFTAFSREQDEKVYVTHRITENKELLWKILQSNGVVFVCGDGKSMAKSVTQALKDVVSEMGKMAGEEADSFLKNLSDSSRFLLDVW